MKSFMYGLKRGFPIFLGYLPVSFTFGFMAVSGGIPVWAAVLISLTNVTSAGQFAGTNLIFASAGYLEIALTTFVINLRYSLMSLSLSQKIRTDVPIWKRLILSFCITDETFVMASMEPGQIGAGFSWNFSRRNDLDNASGRTSICHGNRSLRNVYRTDCPSCPRKEKRLFCCPSCGTLFVHHPLRSRIEPHFFGLPRNLVNNHCRRNRCPAFPGTDF